MQRAWFHQEAKHTWAIIMIDGLFNNYYNNNNKQTNRETKKSQNNHTDFTLKTHRDRNERRTVRCHLTNNQWFHMTSCMTCLFLWFLILSIFTHLDLITWIPLLTAANCVNSFSFCFAEGEIASSSSCCWYWNWRHQVVPRGRHSRGQPTRRLI